MIRSRSMRVVPSPVASEAPSSRASSPSSQRDHLSSRRPTQLPHACEGTENSVNKSLRSDDPKRRAPLHAALSSQRGRASAQSSKQPKGRLCTGLDAVLSAGAEAAVSPAMRTPLSERFCTPPIAMAIAQKRAAPASSLSSRLGPPARVLSFDNTRSPASMHSEAVPDDRGSLQPFVHASMWRSPCPTVGPIVAPMVGPIVAPTVGPIEAPMVGLGGPMEGVSLARPFGRSERAAEPLQVARRVSSAPMHLRRCMDAGAQSTDSSLDTDEACEDEEEGLEDLLGCNASPFLPGEESRNEVGLDDTLLTGVMTALTLDGAADGPPRLLVASRTRRRSDFEDVRELVFAAVDGAPTTLMLSFGNERDASMVVRSQAVQMRLDPSAEAQEAFSVRPAVLTVPARREGTLLVTFAPALVGVYSGVLNLKCRQKSFTFLLRGESTIGCLPPQPCSHIRQSIHTAEKVDVPRAPSSYASAVRSDGEVDGADEETLCSDACEQRAYIRDWLHRSSSQNCRSAQRDLIPIACSPSLPELSPTSCPDLYRATFELRNRTATGISASLRAPLSFLQPDASEIDLLPFSSRMVNVVFDRTMCRDSWDSLYIVVALANGFVQHVEIGCSRIDFRGNKYKSPALESEPQVRHQRLEKSVSIVSGLYFRRNIVDFGEVVVGSLNRQKVELCNATDHPITVHLADPPLPFVLLHNEVLLRPRSYVRIPIRFVPIACTIFSAELTVQSFGGSHVLTLQLRGKASVFGR